MGIAFFLFFSVTHKIGLFSRQTDNNTAKTSAIPIFNARDASGRTTLEWAPAFASMPTDEAETEGARGFGGVTRWWAGRGPIGRHACACWSALPPPPLTSLATVQRRRRRQHNNQPKTTATARRAKAQRDTATATTMAAARRATKSTIMAKAQQASSTTMTTTNDVR